MDANSFSIGRFHQQIVDFTIALSMPIHVFIYHFKTFVRINKETEL